MAGRDGKVLCHVKADFDRLEREGVMDVLSGEPGGMRTLMLFLRLCHDFFTTDGRLVARTDGHELPLSRRLLSRMVDGFTPDEVLAGLRSLMKAGLLMEDERGTLCIRDHSSWVVSESRKAAEMRRYRAGRKGDDTLHCSTSGPLHCRVSAKDAGDVVRHQCGKGGEKMVQNITDDVVHHHEAEKNAKVNSLPDKKMNNNVRPDSKHYNVVIEKPYNVVPETPYDVGEKRGDGPYNVGVDAPYNVVRHENGVKKEQERTKEIERKGSSPSQSYKYDFDGSLLSTEPEAAVDGQQTRCPATSPERKTEAPCAEDGKADDDASGARADRPDGDRNGTTSCTGEDGYLFSYEELGLSPDSLRPVERCDYDFYARTFNEICTSFPAIRQLNNARRRAIKAAERDHGREEIIRAFHKAEKSDYLAGRKGELGWQPNFDWIMREGNLIKILEGTYDERRPTRRRKEETGDRRNDYDEYM